MASDIKTIIENVFSFIEYKKWIRIKYTYSVNKETMLRYPEEYPFSKVEKIYPKFTGIKTELGEQ